MNPSVFDLTIGEKDIHSPGFGALFTLKLPPRSQFSEILHHDDVGAVAS